MVDVQVPPQIQQWTFEKAAARPDRSDSAATSPDLYDTEAVRIPPSAAESPDEPDRPESFYQDRYLSSEEDLSSMEDSYDEEDVVFEGGDDYVSAKAVQMPASSKAKACDMAVVVSYMSAGRPKIVNLTTVSPSMQERQRPGRSASLVDLPAVFRANLANQSPRFSLSAGTPSQTLYNPAAGPPPRKNLAPELSALRISTSPPSARSSIPSPVSSMGSLRRPKTARATSSQYSQASRASFHINTTAASANPSINSPSTASPFTPQTPSFLSSDPFAPNSASAASPMTKNPPHKRLRSFSRGLSLAKNSILPTYKKVDPRDRVRVGGAWGVIGESPTTPRTPVMPMTPASAGPKASIVSPKKGVKLVARGANEREPILELPPLSRDLEIEEARERARDERVRQLKAKLVPRGANERAPTLELPPCPDSDVESVHEKVPTRRLRKRRSLMDFEKLTHLM